MKNQIWKKIENKKLRVVDLYKSDLKDSLTEFGHSTKDYAKFGAFYELYLFGFVIGYQSKERYTNLEEESLETFNTISEWKNENKTLLKNFLAALLCDKNIRNETGFDFFKSNKPEEKDIDVRIKKLILIFEEYANAGLKIIHNKYVSNHDEFDHFMSLQSLHEEILKNNH